MQDEVNVLFEAVILETFRLHGFGVFQEELQKSIEKVFDGSYLLQQSRTMGCDPSAGEAELAVAPERAHLRLSVSFEAVVRAR